MEDEKQKVDQIVSDLSWIFTSAPMIKSESHSIQMEPLKEAWLTEQGGEPYSSKIFQFMKGKNLRMLGPYFEALWEFYLNFYPGKKLIAKNLQVFSGIKTLGEFDFIYLDEESGEYRHLEVSIKYFLGLSESILSVDNGIRKYSREKGATNTRGGSRRYSSMDQWVGPNTNDRLDKKYTKMLDSQSQLSKTPEGKEALESIGIDSSKLVKSEICLRGYLFYPLDTCLEDPMFPPEDSHTDHNRGYWLRESQLDKLLPQDEWWGVLDKPFWLAPLRLKLQQLDSREDIKNTIHQHFSISQRPLLISSFLEKRKNVESSYMSDINYFIVPDCWPEKV